jgi:sulfatase modifying factor 1
MLFRIFVLILISATVFAQTGTLKIVTNAAGSIKIDGENKGSIEGNAVKKFELNADDYIVQFFPQSSNNPITKEVSIQTGKSETINFEVIAPNQQNNSATNSSNLLLPEMVFVQGGTFMMGCTAEQGIDCSSNEKPAHSVTLSSFYIGKYEVTQAQWEKVMGTEPSHFKLCPNCPVENVSWDDIQQFIQKLNRQTGKRYRLPTEAEWEYAARGGAKSQGYKYSGSNDLDDIAWYEDNASTKTQSVGRKKPNELGIYDMSGNVWEMCSDWYGESYYNSSRALRGGGWSNSPEYCRVSLRSFSVLDSSGSQSLGFRLVLEL